METYNGWKNRQTWNVALWIGNDEGLYNAAVAFVKRSKRQKGIYVRFIKAMGLEHDRTPDNIAWLGSRLDYKALSEMMVELVGTGGTQNFKWSPARPVATMQEAISQKESLQRMGYKAIIHRTTALSAIGLPETYDIEKEVKP